MKLFSTHRFLLHFPVGAVTAWFCIEQPLIGIFLNLWFAAYELNEDFHVKDGAFIDIIGFAFGLAAGGIAYRALSW